MKKFKFWRKLKGGTWYLHEFTKHAVQLSFIEGNRWWSRTNIDNRYSVVVLTETYK